MGKATEQTVAAPASQMAVPLQVGLADAKRLAGNLQKRLKKAKGWDLSTAEALDTVAAMLGAGSWQVYLAQNEPLAKLRERLLVKPLSPEHVVYGEVAGDNYSCAAYATWLNAARLQKIAGLFLKAAREELEEAVLEMGGTEWYERRVAALGERLEATLANDDAAYLLLTPAERAALEAVEPARMKSDCDKVVVRAAGYLTLRCYDHWSGALCETREIYLSDLFPPLTVAWDEIAAALAADGNWRCGALAVKRLPDGRLRVTAPGFASSCETEAGALLRLRLLLFVG